MATTSPIQTVSPSNVILIPTRTVPYRFEKYNKDVAIAFGCIQICLGITSIALNATAIGIYIAWPTNVGYGIWSAPLWILAGSFGIAAGYNKSKCTITTTLVLSIIASGTMTYYLSLTIVQYVDVCGMFSMWNSMWNCSVCGSQYYYRSEAEDWGVTSGILMVGVLELVFSVLAAAQCCKAVCCCRNNVDHQHQIRHQLPATYAYMNQAAPQAVYLPPGCKLVYNGNEQQCSQVSGQQVIGINQSTIQSPPPYGMSEDEPRY